MKEIKVKQKKGISEIESFEGKNIEEMLWDEVEERR